MSEAAPTIFLVKYRALGDSIMGLSTLTYLRSIYPNSKIYYGVRDWTADLYKNVKTDADGIIPLSLNNFSDYLSLWTKVKELKVDHIHEMHVSGRTRKFFKIFSMLTSTKYTFHDHHFEGKSLVVDQGSKKALIQRDLDGAYSFLGLNRDIPCYLNFVPTMKDLSVSKDNSIVLGVVATRETKMWSLENYVLLARKINESYPEIKIKVPLSKSIHDTTLRKELHKLDTSNILSIINEPVEDLANLMGKSHLYIGNDTGLKHLAISCGIKSFTFFGPEPPKEWHPYDDSVHPYFYVDNLDCRTKDGHYCALNTCASMICLKDISVEEVFNQVEKDLL